VLVQRNDRAPQFLYPKLDDRGYAHETIEADGAVVTAIWMAGDDTGVSDETVADGRTDEEGDR